MSIKSYPKFRSKYLKTLCNPASLKELTDKELIKIKNINNEISINELNKVYIPISKLLNFYITLNLHKQKITLKQILSIKNSIKIPYIIGITGSVAVGKSTTAQLLQSLLSRWPEHNKVDIITTDGFLYSNEFLNKHGLMKKKGFPQSYNMYHLVKFITDIKLGIKKVTAPPTYSHFTYDIVPDKKQVLEQPDILILEGLNILQNNAYYLHDNPYCDYVFIPDFIDFSIYIDAPKKLLKKWYIDRFLKLCDNALYHPYTYFYRYSQLKQEEIIKTAKIIWEKNNKINLEENIAPTKEKASLIIMKGSNHSILNVKLKNNFKF